MSSSGSSLVAPSELCTFNNLKAEIRVSAHLVLESTDPFVQQTHSNRLQALLQGVCSFELLQYLLRDIIGDTSTVKLLELSRLQDRLFDPLFDPRQLSALSA